MPHWATSLHTCYGPSCPSPNNNGNGPRFPPDPVGVGGLALWHGHPERRCRPSSVVHASGPPLQHLSALFITITSVYQCLIRMGETGSGRWQQTYPVPSRGPSQVRQWITHVLGNCICCLACAPSVLRCDVCMPFNTSDRPRNLWPLILRH